MYSIMNITILSDERKIERLLEQKSNANERNGT